MSKESFHDSPGNPILVDDASALVPYAHKANPLNTVAPNWESKVRSRIDDKLGNENHVLWLKVLHAYDSCYANSSFFSQFFEQDDNSSTTEMGN